MLGYPPTDNVTIALTDASDPNQVTLSSDLVFEPGNYNVAQTVTVTAVDDDVLENDPHSTVIQHVVTSGDLSYNGYEIDDVTVTIAENDCGAWGYRNSDVNTDCDVNLLDFAIMAADWLTCTTPYSEGCTMP